MVQVQPREVQEQARLGAQVAQEMGRLGQVAGPPKQAQGWAPVQQAVDLVRLAQPRVVEAQGMAGGTLVRAEAM